MTRLLFAFLAVGLFTLAQSTAADPAPKVPKDTCVKPCWECANECLHCMKHARDHKMEVMAKQCEICHTMCLTCYHAVGAKNARAWEICELCEKVCNDCAAECAKGTDDHAKKCAKACQDCAKACADARK